MYFKMEKIKKWKNEKGNFCFSYDMAEPFQKPWIIIVIGILFISVIASEYLVYDTYITIFPISVVFTFIFIYWASYPLKKNDIINEKIIEKNVDLRLHNIIKNYGSGTHEVRRKLHYETKGTYGQIIGIYMLVLLSNKEILIYELKSHRTPDGNNTYFEFIVKPEIDANSRFRKIIDKKKLSQRYVDWKLSSKTKLLILSLSIIFFGGALFSLIFYFSDLFEKKFLWYIIPYVLFLNLMRFSNKKVNNKFFKVLYFAISLPVMFIFLVIKLTHPFFIISTSCFLLGLIALGIPFGTISLVNLIFTLNFSLATISFLTFSIGSIFSVYGSKIIHWIIKNYSPVKDWGNHDYEAVNIELALYVLHRNNINFIIYFSYFIYLFISGFLFIQYNKPFLTEDIDGAILKSFLVFIAFSNVVTKSKDVDLEAKSLLEKMLRLISS